MALIVLFILGFQKHKQGAIVREQQQIANDSPELLREYAVDESIADEMSDSDIAQETLKALGINDWYDFVAITDTTGEYWRKHVSIGEFERPYDCGPQYYVNFNIHNTSDYDIYLVEPPNHGMEFPEYFEIPAHSVYNYCWPSAGDILFFIGKLRQVTASDWEGRPYKQAIPTEVKECFSIRYRVPVSIVQKWARQILKELNDSERAEIMDSGNIMGCELMYIGGWAKQDINNWQDLRKFIQ